MRDKGRKGKIISDYSWDIPKRVIGEKDRFMEGRMSCEARVAEYIMNYGRVFNEFR